MNEIQPNPHVDLNNARNLRRSDNFELPAPSASSAQSAVQTLNDLAPIKTYRTLRDDLWSELCGRATGHITRYEIGILGFANHVVKILLQDARRKGDLGLSNALELLRCKVCETFVAQVRVEIECQRPQSDIPVLRPSLQLASIDAPDLVRSLSDGYGG